MAVEEINAAGGIKGNQIDLVTADSKSKPDVSVKNVTDMIDNQGVQTVYAVKCKPQTDVLRDKFKLDYVEVLSSIKGKDAVMTRAEWVGTRTTAGLPPNLEPLPGEQLSGQ
jgi:hypothetical protein